MTEIIGVIAQISALTFILTSMLVMGLSLTVKQIMDPLRNTRVVLLALLANFILVPALEGDQLSYSVEILDGEIPASGGAGRAAHG